jgi:hypothetical protein
MVEKNKKIRAGHTAVMGRQGMHIRVQHCWEPPCTGITREADKQVRE